MACLLRASDWPTVRSIERVRRVVFAEITPEAMRAGLQSSARHRHQSRRRAAGSPRSRPTRRLQTFSAAVEEGAPGAVRRTRSVGCSPSGRRPRARDPRVRSPVEYWTIEVPFETLPDAGPGAPEQFTSSLHSVGGKKIEISNEDEATATRRGDPQRRHLHRRRGAPARAEAEPAASVHHFDASAGSRSQARASRRARRWLSRSSSTKESSSDPRARSDSSLTCEPTQCIWRPAAVQESRAS